MASSSRLRLRRRPASLLFAALAVALALPTAALADRGRDHDRDRGRGPSRHHHDTSYSIGFGLSSRGLDSWHIGVSRDSYRRDRYFRPYYRSGFYPGFFVRTLPRHHRRVVFDSTVYFVADDIYYRPYDSGYVVVERPVVIERPVSTVRYAVTDDGVNPNQEIGAPAPAEPASAKGGPLSVWQGDQELRLIDGEFFKPTTNGLVWVDTPVGAVSDVLPIGAQVVWHNDIEYFRFDGVVFRKSPDGYKVVAAPWDDHDDAS